MSVTPRGMSVQEAYRQYREGAFRVNRKYQRKLVWTVDEKRSLVDSLLRGYPIPLVLLATRSRSDGSKEFEILDGMQRLNAIFMYIENAYATTDGLYFDTEQLPRTKQLVESGEILSHPDHVLEPKQCADLLEYTLAVTEFPAVNEAAVNEVFSRINAYGRQLSPQERRQAGVVTEFAGVIRELASEIRGDVSSDSLDLAEMAEISIEVGGEELGYAIKAEETFWCKQGVLRRSQLRDSEDEQMLADLAISVLYEEPVGFSGKQLDEYYSPGSSAELELDAKLREYGPDALRNDVQTVISIIRDAVEEYDSSRNALGRLLHPTAGSNPIKTPFYALFMAFFDLCVREEKSPSDTSKIMAAVSDLQNRLATSRGQITAEQRKGNVAVTKGLIQDHFDDREPPATQTGRGLAIRFENALRRARIETPAYECKQGLVRLDGDRSKDDGLLERIPRTLCAIANIGPNQQGALFIGVADNESDAARVTQLDGIEPRRVGSRLVVGIDRELSHLGLNLEGYKRLVVDTIRNSALSDPLKADVLTSVDCIDYRGASVICIWVPRQSEPAAVADELYVREGSETKPATGLTATQAVVGRFGGG